MGEEEPKRATPRTQVEQIGEQKEKEREKEQKSIRDYACQKAILLFEKHSKAT